MKIEEIRKWYINKRKLYFASIELTQNCNFKCRHCYCANKQSNNLSLEEHKNIIDKLYNTGCLFLNFTGGEIFTYKNFIEIYTYAKNKGFIIDLLTNASLIDNRLITVFKNLPPNSIAVTLYGTNEEDYLNFTGDRKNFHKVMNALNLLKENNITFVLRTIGARTLQKSLMNDEFEKIAKKFNTTFKYDPIIFPKTTGDTAPLDECMNVDQIIELESKNALRKSSWETAVCNIKNSENFCWSCQAGISSMAIDYKGDAYVCGLYRNKPISVLENSFDDVLEYLQKIHEEHIKIIESNQCSRCDKRSICKWCPAYSFIYNQNDYEKVDFFCRLSQARVKYFGKQK